MPNYKCRCDVVWSPGRYANKADAVLRINYEMPSYVSAAIADHVVTDAADEDEVMEKVVAEINDLRGNGNGTISAVPNDDWNYGSGGLHEDDRALEKDNAPWQVSAKRADDASQTIDLTARLRVVSVELA